MVLFGCREPQRDPHLARKMVVLYECTCILLTTLCVSLGSVFTQDLRYGVGVSTTSERPECAHVCRAHAGCYIVHVL